jgi:hypothetical protein
MTFYCKYVLTYKSVFQQAERNINTSFEIFLNKGRWK